MTSPLLKMTLREIQDFMIESVAHCRALGMQVVDCGEGRLVFDLPYREELGGDPQTGGMHGGAIMTLLDTTCGNVVLTRLDELRRTATLDLRIDYPRPARAGRTIRCEAVCDSADGQVAFVRGVAYDDAPSDVVAVAVGTFAIFRAPSSAKIVPAAEKEA